jgi:hypothetical protein
LELLIPLVVFVGLARAGWLLAVRARMASALDRMVCGAAFPLVAVVVAVQALGRLGLLTQGLLLALLLAVMACVFTLTPAADERVAIDDFRRGMRVLRDAPNAVACLLVGVPLACALAALSASALLETWAWDSLGYHLPLVHDVVQTGRLRVVPGRLAFIETYPRFVELFFAGFRVLLGHERFVDFGQIAFVPLLCAAPCRVARRLGASSFDALAFALAPLALPVVYMQCASNYVDVAYAALLFAGLSYLVDAATTAEETLAGTFLGLALATKPTAPVALAVGVTVSLIARVLMRAPLRRTLLAHARIALLATAIGAKVYVENVLRFGNPVWPMSLHLGPWHLPGTMEPHDVFDQGLSAAQREWGWAARVAFSWFHAPAGYVYDQRFGGFGPVFGYALLPLLVVALVRVPRARVLACVVGAATLAQGGAFIARYTMALPMLAFALAPAALESLRPSLRDAGKSLVIALLAVGAILGGDGFTDGGPSLASLARMTPRARAARVSVDVRGAEWFDVRAELRPGDAFAFDGSVGLTGLGFRADGQSRLLYVGDEAPTGAALDAAVDTERVQFLAVHRDRADALGPRFVRRFACDVDPCMVFEVRPRTP